MEYHFVNVEKRRLSVEDMYSLPDGPIHQMQRIYQHSMALPFDKAPQNYKNYMLTLMQKNRKDV